jgi:hypothetical protein
MQAVDAQRGETFSKLHEIFLLILLQAYSYHFTAMDKHGK